ncbi:MAG: Txe/YoeB family addiction module toxin [Sphingomonas bacterium]|uniref:Txe/YoeB family addiction module toxin n=1 Tax=Sphingomonas bacterium TaxID=1895847 RepID=UPI00260D7C5B|nr:Txe/YoeB family addiction module toxin [Sphingomonas bacterium]MDB5706237.1 Txe/YoeB family addiction module toxin [Sphingomonas bacterium]
MRIAFAPDAAADYEAWRLEDGTVFRRLNALLQECLRDPFNGTGKPEALSGLLSGWWSRWITREHRLVYRVIGSGEARALEIAQCRYHY